MGVLAGVLGAFWGHLGPSWGRFGVILAPKRKARRIVAKGARKTPGPARLFGAKLGCKMELKCIQSRVVQMTKNKFNIRGSWDRFLIDFWMILGGQMEPCWRPNGAQDGSYLENTLYPENIQKPAVF